MHVLRSYMYCRSDCPSLPTMIAGDGVRITIGVREQRKELLALLSL